MRPADDVAILLNVEREFAVLFHDYETFEARTLLAYDRAYERFEDVIIDKSIRFLISRDRLIRESINHYLQQDIEYPIIIPFFYGDVEIFNPDSIFTKIRQNYFIRDLFAHQAPLKNEYFFFGRERLVSDVIDLHRSGQNSGLFGLRKSGKTSTIYAIQRKSKSFNFKSVVLDCQDPSVHARRYNSLLQHILCAVREKCGLRSKVDDVPDRPELASDVFKSAMMNIFSQIGTGILLIFDEIENISPKTAASDHWRAGNDTVLFWQTLRSFSQHAGKFKLTFCLVGTNPNLLEIPHINGVDNPVYLFAKKMYIPSLAESDTRKMLKHLGFYMGLDFPDEVISHIHSLYGGHPFFTRQLCSHIHLKSPLSRPLVVSMRLCRESAAEAQATLKTYIEQIFEGLQRFYPDEHFLLELLACGKLDEFSEYTRGSPEVIEHLIGYNIVVRRGVDFDLCYEIIRQVVLTHANVEDDGSREAMRTEISRRRNKVEEEVRVALFHWGRALSSDEWEEACRRCIPKRVKDQGLPPKSTAFARTQSPLSLIELLQFMKFSGICGAADEHARRIYEAVDFVNQYRVDAHAKGLTRIQYEKCGAALDILEGTFVPPE